MYSYSKTSALLYTYVQHTVELHTVELLTVELHTVELHTVELHSVGYVFCVLCIIFLCGPKELIWILEEDKHFKIIYYLSSYAADILIVCCNLYALRSRSLCTFFRLEPARQCCYMWIGPVSAQGSFEST